MVIKIDYTSSDVYVSTSVSPVYVVVNYSGTSGGGVWGQITGTLSDQTDLQDALDDKVPYTGATGNVDLGEYELKAGQIEFDQSPTGTAGVGVMRWNDTDGTLDLGLKGGNVTLQVGQEQILRVVNKTGADLLESQYRAVRIRLAAEGGSQGQRLAVVLAQGNNDANSTDTIGIVTENITDNQEGFICTSGIVRNINTTGSLQGETWADGDVLYLSPTTAGAITNIKPIAPNHTVVLGYVVYAHANNGKIFVKCDNGYEIGELHDVYVPSPSNNDGIFWNSTNLRYQNNTIAGALGYTPVNPTRSIATTSPLTGGGDLSADRTLSIPAATTSVNGYLTSTDWNTFNNKQATLTLTTTGTSGAATLVGATLNIPQYSGGGGGNTIYSGDGTLAGDRIITSNGKRLTILGGKEDIASNQSSLRLETSDTTKSVVALELKNTYTTTGKLWQLRSISNGNFDIANRTDGVANITCFPSGRVALGQTAVQIANANVSLNGMVATDGAIQVQGTIAGTSATGNGIEIDWYNSTGYFTAYGRTSGLWYPIVIRGSQIDFITYGSGATSRFTSAGRLLIGTTTEGTYLLDVNGTARVSSDTAIDGVLRETVTTNRQTASYSVVLTDRGKLVEMNVASANNLTVPLNSSIAFPVGTKIDIAQYGAGQTTVVATSGVTIRSAGGALKLTSQYSGATLVKIATDEWYLFGNITT